MQHAIFYLEAHSCRFSGLFHDLHHIPGNLHIPAEYLFAALGNQFADSLNFIKPLILRQFQFLCLAADGMHRMAAHFIILPVVCQAQIRMGNPLLRRPFCRGKPDNSIDYKQCHNGIDRQDHQINSRFQRTGQFPADHPIDDGEENIAGQADDQGMI